MILGLSYHIENEFTVDEVVDLAQFIVRLWNSREWSDDDVYEFQTRFIGQNQYQGVIDFLKSHTAYKIIFHQGGYETSYQNESNYTKPNQSNDNNNNNYYAEIQPELYSGYIKPEPSASIAEVESQEFNYILPFPCENDTDMSNPEVQPSVAGEDGMYHSNIYPVIYGSPFVIPVQYHGVYSIGLGSIESFHTYEIIISFVHHGMKWVKRLSDITVEKGNWNIVSQSGLIPLGVFNDKPGSATITINKKYLNRSKEWVAIGKNGVDNRIILCGVRYTKTGIVKFTRKILHSYKDPFDYGFHPVPIDKTNEDM
jgi:hypothetical protein